MIDNAAFGAILDDGTLRFERLLPGPIERVWDYLTQRDLLARWIAPFALPSTPGATFEHRWDGGGTLTGRIRIYDAPSVLEYDWNEGSAPGGPIEFTVVRFELTPQGENVKLVLTHRLLPRNSYGTVAGGWHAHTDALIAALRGAPAVDRDTRYEELAPSYRMRLDIGT
jgi:uncharacterized protein YndB with AHSA1/START domain